MWHRLTARSRPTRLRREMGPDFRDESVCARRVMRALLPLYVEERWDMDDLS